MDLLVLILTLSTFRFIKPLRGIILFKSICIDWVIFSYKIH